MYLWTLAILAGCASLTLFLVALARLSPGWAMRYRLIAPYLSILCAVDMIYLMATETHMTALKFAVLLMSATTCLILGIIQLVRQQNISGAGHASDKR